MGAVALRWHWCCLEMMRWRNLGQASRKWDCVVATVTTVRRNCLLTQGSSALSPQLNHNHHRRYGTTAASDSYSEDIPIWPSATGHLANGRQDAGTGQGNVGVRES